MGESLVMWVEAMRPLEDASKNRWTMTDFSVMMVAVDIGPHLSNTPWQPDRSPIEHDWDMKGRRLHLQGNADDLAPTIEANFGKKYSGRPSAFCIILFHVVWQLASRLECG
ncbi:hypothetical protein TNCV_2002311 [Trichonephila clavipes]|nr:hypothetical protein TNCV_2002311 [Trichonephila clavipes]